MDIEIVEAYLVMKDLNERPKGWSLHVYIPELDMDLRGIQLLKTSSGWYLRMPHLTNWGIDEKKMISFPVITFVENEKTRNFTNLIKEKGVALVEEKLKKGDEFKKLEKAKKEIQQEKK